MIPAVSTEQRMEEPPETAISQESTFERLNIITYIGIEICFKSLYTLTSLKRKELRKP